MPRKGPAPRRDLVADPVYRSVLVTQLVNKVMLHGKRSLAERIVYDAMEIVEDEDRRRAARRRVKRAIDNVKPPLEVKSRRVGGATYQVPVEVRPRRATTLAIRWVVDFSRARREKTMAECLADELMDAANGLGAAIKRRDDMQKMAESNKAFAHYRFGDARRSALRDEQSARDVRVSLIACLQLPEDAGLVGVWQGGGEAAERPLRHGGGSDRHAVAASHGVVEHDDPAVGEVGERPR